MTLAGQFVFFPGVGSAAGLTFVVNTATDHNDGSCNADCTLREAILAANAAPGHDTVSFAIPGAGPHLISLATNLPIVSTAVTIDATTQPGYVTTPVVELRGSAVAVGLRIDAGNSTVRGLAINGFAEGIAGGRRRLEHDRGEPHRCVRRRYDGDREQPERCPHQLEHQQHRDRQHARRQRDGRRTSRSGADSNTITANAIGTDPTGTSNLANTSDNVTVFTDGNIIGGTTPGSANVIANAGRNGVYITGQNNQVLGNSIFGNALEGIALEPMPNANVTGSPIAHDRDGWVRPSTTAAGSIAGGVAPYTLELFTTPVCDASGRGEGRTFLGRAQVAVTGAFSVTVNAS